MHISPYVFVEIVSDNFSKYHCCRGLLIGSRLKGSLQKGMPVLINEHQMRIADQNLILSVPDNRRNLVISMRGKSISVVFFQSVIESLNFFWQKYEMVKY